MLSPAGADRPRCSLSIFFEARREKMTNRLVVAENGFAFPAGYDPTSWRFEWFYRACRRKGNRDRFLQKVEKATEQVVAQMHDWIAQHSTQAEIKFWRTDRIWSPGGVEIFSHVFYTPKPEAREKEAKR